jgi:hypothetical protein
MQLAWRTMLIAAAVATVLTGCGKMDSIADGVLNPMTPEQSKAQVVDAAKDVGRAVQQPAIRAFFSRSSCNDQGESPFRGQVNIFYQAPADPAAARAAFDQIKAQLQAAGWTSDDDFKSHGTTLKKNTVEAVLYPADASVADVLVILYGECRDTTTTKTTKGSTETITVN